MQFIQGGKGGGGGAKGGRGILQLSKAENHYFRQYGERRPEFYTKAEPTKLQTKLFLTIPLPK